MNPCNCCGALVDDEARFEANFGYCDDCAADTMRAPELLDGLKLHELYDFKRNAANHNDAPEVQRIENAIDARIQRIGARR
jgi:hypothetical protein